MVTFTPGETTTDGTEQTLFDITSDKNFATWLFVDALTATETLEVKVFVKDEQDAVMRRYEKYRMSGVQGSPAKFIPFVPTKQYKVTIKLISGTNRAISWQRVEA